jgi:BirA family transcriptional regulator, biotin operon repressor / biotin---[acetyl-CoA-carboxylase] ligase
MVPSDATPPAGGTSSGPGSAGWPAGWHVTVVDETGSTNTDLAQAAEAGAPDRSVLVARHQTAGRGRLDRTWVAPPGANLLVSLLFRNLPEHRHELTQRVGLAACAAVRSCTSLHPVLKWPNDVLLDGAKLAGVLAQSGRDRAGAAYVVVGIGVNVGWAPDGAARLGDSVTPDALLVSLLDHLDRLPAVIGDEYRSVLATIGQRVRADLPSGSLVGRAVDVDDSGRLVIVDDCALSHVIDTADVIHLRPAE